MSQTTKYEILVNPVYLQVKPALDLALKDKLRKKTRYKVEGYMFTEAYRSGGWDGYKYLFQNNQTAQSGLYRKLQSLLEEEGQETKVVFHNCSEPVGEKDTKVFDLQLDEDQMNAVNRAVENRICILNIPIRGGKTAILGGIINRLSLSPTCIITKDRDLVRQTKIALEKHTNQTIGYFSESTLVSENILVTSYTALAAAFSEALKNKVSEKIKQRNKIVHQFVNDAKVLLLDECQYAFSPKTKEILTKFKSASYRIAVSGTPRPDSVTAIEMESLLGPVVMKVQFKKLIDKNRIAKPYVILYELPDEWYSYDLREFSDIYEANIVKNTRRNEFIASVVAQLYKVGKSCFVMVNRLDHGVCLKSLIPNSFFVNGSIETQTRFDLYKALQEKTIGCVISTVGRVGLNLPKLDAVVNAEGLKSEVSTIQKMRSLTFCEGKDRGLVIDFMDKGAYLSEHSHKRSRQYEGIKGFTIKYKKVDTDYEKQEQTNG